MPRVSRRQYPFEDQGDFFLVVNVSPKGIFSAKLPQRVTEILGYDKVTSDTNEDVLRKFTEAIEEYKSARTTTRKVIAYDFNCAAKEFTANDGTDHEYHEMGFVEGLGLSVWAVVCEESVRTMGDDKQRYDYEELPSSIPDVLRPQARNVNSHREQAEHIIDWTQDREDFFVRLAGIMQEMIARLKSFEKPDKLIERIDSGRLLEG